MRWRVRTGWGRWITELAQYGYPELVPAAFSEHNPFTAAYWTSGKVPYDRALLTHRVKTMFGFNELAEATDNDVKGKRALEKLRYMM